MDESNCKKEPLDAAMHISHVFEDERQSYKTLLWTIRTYNLLKLNSVYDCYNPVVDWRMLIKKETDCVKIIVKSKHIEDNIICSVVYDDNEILYRIAGTKIAEEVYSFEFPSSVIEDPKYKPLERDHVLFSFEFNKIPEIKQVYARNPTKKNESSQLRLMKDLQSFAVKQKLNLNAIGEDNQLTINASGKDILVPKALLAARSEFFKTYDENKKYVNASEESVHIAVEYLYTNVLPVSLRDDDIEELIEVAQSLKIKSLELKCLHLIRKNSAHDYPKKYSSFPLEMSEIQNS